MSYTSLTPSKSYGSSMTTQSQVPAALSFNEAVYYLDKYHTESKTKISSHGDILGGKGSDMYVTHPFLPNVCSDFSIFPNDDVESFLHMLKLRGVSFLIFSMYRSETMYRPIATVPIGSSAFMNVISQVAIIVYLILPFELSIYLINYRFNNSF